MSDVGKGKAEDGRGKTEDGGEGKEYSVPPKWDGRAAERIWKVLCDC